MPNYLVQFYMLLRGTLFQMLIACSFLRNVRSETNWHGHFSFTATFLAGFIINFHWQGDTLVSGILESGSFPNHSFGVVIYDHEGFVIHWKHRQFDSCLDKRTNIAALLTVLSFHNTVAPFWNLWRITVSITSTFYSPTS